MFGKAYKKIFNILGDGYGSGVKENHMQRNELTYAINLSILASYVMNSYRFEGLPEEIDQNLMWAILTQYSTAVMFKHDESGEFMVLPYRKDHKSHQTYNYMYKPPRVVAMDFLKKEYKVTTVGKPLEDDYEGSLLYISNTSRFNVDLHLMMDFYAMKMTDIDRAIDVRRNYHRAPAIFTGDEKMKSSIEKFFEAITEFKPFYVTTERMMEGFNMTNMDFNYINDKLFSEKQEYQNEFLNLWGINNNDYEDKKERVTTVEVNANNEQLLINRSNVINSLQDFCDDFNNKFGYDVKVKYENNDVDDESKLFDFFDTVGGDDDAFDL